MYYKRLSIIGVFSLILPLALKAQQQEQAKLNEDLTSYFSSTIETDQLNNPAQAWYKKNITAADLPEYRKQLWAAWKKANAARLATWPVLKPNSAKDSLVWQLPTGKKALFGAVKKGSPPSEGYPMYINLHGGGTFPTVKTEWGSADNNSEWAAAKYLSMRYADIASLYFVPRMADDRRGRWYHKGEQTEFIRAWQLGVLSGDVNPDRTYIIGISEGGYGSFRMGPFFADYFAGAGPMAGVSSITEAPLENMRNTPFYITVGEFDSAYGRARGGLQWKKALDSAAAVNPGQFKHVVDIQKGKGHGIDYFQTTPWLKQFKRNPYPDTLSFQYYAVHDTVFNKQQDTSFTYRKGFGYVRLDGLFQTAKLLPDGLLQTSVSYFYIEKKGNIYHLNSGNSVGEVKGTIAIYVDQVDFSKPVKVYYKGALVYDKKLQPNVGVMAESLALFGDPRRIFPAKVSLKID